MLPIQMPTIVGPLYAMQAKKLMQYIVEYELRSSDMYRRPGTALDVSEGSSL